MSRTILFRVPAKGNETPVFPERCVACGGPRQAESTMVLSRLVVRGKGTQEQVSIRCQVPHCRRCAQATKSLFLATFTPFFLGFLLVGTLSFVGGTLGALALGLEDVNRPRTAGSSLLVGAALSLVLGLLAGFIFEALARLLLLPFFGRGLLQAPLLAVEFILGLSYVVGLRGKLSRAGDYLELKFANDEIAGEFERLNAHRLHGGQPGR